ncbi:uncharacterized protein PV09_05339 [Verruconis gallopava]|uniref:SGF29 C-terminal domain-containing protein n=1 Tax=Verruconis gallopava TaxID=253628 RepID=A0A0D2AWQ6_9PEZI|nr:uncharacterized protein PV09_05339 [Verruconis gallopava]KIW03584.1 hypothetical protein PV09_05339 [Verruconis gallopava]
MTGRNRNRPAIMKEADEESQLWSEVKNSGSRIDQLVAEHNEKWKRMAEIKQLLDIQFSRDEEPSEDLEDELMKLTRENVKICDELVAAIEGDSEQDTNSLLGALNLLSALRASSEAESHTPAPRSLSTAKSGRNAKRKGGDASSVVSDDRESAAADSPAAPSPKVHIPVPSRLKVNTNASSRAGSVGAGREASVKIEEGTESGVDAKPSHSDRPKFQVGTEVLYRKKGVGKVDPNDGEGMLCQVTSVIGEGKQRRYEIRDADAEAVDPQPYRASLQQMTPIPALGTVLPELKPKTHVLALYPGTTTFYKAEVVTGSKKDGEGPPEGHVRLRFEGEDELEPDKDVERRYVLSEWTGK